MHHSSVSTQVGGKALGRVCLASAKMSKCTTIHPFHMHCLLKSSNKRRTRDLCPPGRSSDISCPSGWHIGICCLDQRASPAPCPSVIFWVEKGLRDHMEQSSYDQRDNMKVIQTILWLQNTVGYFGRNPINAIDCTSKGCGIGNASLITVSMQMLLMILQHIH